MSGGQTDLSLASEEAENVAEQDQHLVRVNRVGVQLKTIMPGARELEAHNQLLARIHKSSGQRCLWLTQAVVENKESLA
jgi:hypothetical protein